MMETLAQMRRSTLLLGCDVIGVIGTSAGTCEKVPDVVVLACR